jgi:hypothetical protein
MTRTESKAVADDIDRAMALVCGLTDEELDFIQNSDTKYRVGRDIDGDDEE